jgi:O-antigen biosynthesis protein
VSDRDHLEARLARLEHRLRQFEYNQRMMNIHITSLENSIIFRILRRVGQPLLNAKGWATQRVMRARFSGMYLRLFPPDPRPYTSWMEHEAAEELPKLTALPRFTILLPIYKPRREWLEEAIASVRGQSYPSWELRICRSSYSEPWLADCLTAAVASDPRISIACTTGEFSISRALNQAAAEGTGSYLLALDPNDRLSPGALHWLATATPADLIYSDEDRLDDEGHRVAPIFKPDWSPDLLLSCMYVGQVMAVSRDVWEQAGRFQCEQGGAHDYDMVLRITDQPVTVRHVPRVLYHRRRSVMDSHTNAAGRRALEDALHRRGALAAIESGPRPGTYLVRWKPHGTPVASLIICSRSPRLLTKCLRAVAERTSYPNREVIVVQHLGNEDAALQAVIKRHGARCLPYAGPFHFSRMNNMAGQIATGGVLVFINDDIQPLESSWLERLLGQLERPDVGIVGARLLYPSGLVQHAGVAVGISDGCGHIGRGVIAAPSWPWLALTRDVAAVTGACLAIRAALFRDLGGFADEFPVNYNDTDLCLRIRAAGYRVVYEAGALLRHYECQTRRGVVSFEERERWYNRWHDVIDAGDPFYSPHLTHDREDLSLEIMGEPRDLMGGHGSLLKGSSDWPRLDDRG